MAQFQKSHPDYQLYVSDHYQMSEFPKEAVDGLHGLISRDSDDLKAIVNLLRAYIPEGPTGNWGRDWLENDLRDAISSLANGPFHKLMNAVAAVSERLSGTTFLSDLEELLTERNLGYRLVAQHNEMGWVLRDDGVKIGTASIDAARNKLPDICEQAMLHLEQAKENFKRGGDRSRKDAIRDAMSAMESLYKQLGGKEDIADAWKALRDEGSWGPSEVVKDGYSIWNTLHHLYPDIRHGQTAASHLTEAEAHYWIDRIATFIKYLSWKRE